MPAAGEGGRRGSLPGGAARFPGAAVPVPPVRICVIGSPPLPPALNKYSSRISLNSLLLRIALLKLQESRALPRWDGAEPASAPTLHLTPKKQQQEPPHLAVPCPWAVPASAEHPRFRDLPAVLPVPPVPAALP